MGNKKFFSLTLILCSILFFLIGYIAGKETNSLNKEVKGQNLTIDVNGVTLSNEEKNKIINASSEITFKIQGKDDNYIIERFKTAEEEGVAGMTLKEIEDKYSKYGYVLKNISSNNIEFVRKPIVYNPNRYVLFTVNNEIVITQSDNNGSIFDKDGNLISKEGTGTKYTSLRPKDIDNIISGNETMQFETIEELNDGFKDFDIKYEMPE